MSFGENVQFMRKMHNGMTQEELAEKMNVSRQTISKWEGDSAFPEMEKAIALSQLFNCSLDELIKEDMNTTNQLYHNLRTEIVKGFSYIRYAVISAMPEDDAIGHIKNFAASVGIIQPEVIGWDFPVVSQEQINVFHMHGYCAACELPNDFKCNGLKADVISQKDAKYAVITIEKPFTAPFSLIPNAYKTLCRYIDTNGLRKGEVKDVLECFEKEYEKDGVSYMDVYIVIDSL